MIFLYNFDVAEFHCLKNPTNFGSPTNFSISLSLPRVRLGRCGGDRSRHLLKSRRGCIGEPESGRNDEAKLLRHSSKRRAGHRRYPRTSRTAS